MISLILSFAVLLIGFFVYGRIIERGFAPDDRKTPAYTRQDGVDFMPMPAWKAFLVQLLNIAGTGPIFGGTDGRLLWTGCFFMDYLRKRSGRRSP